MQIVFRYPIILCFLLLSIANLSFSNTLFEKQKMVFSSKIESVPDSLYPFHPDVNVPCSSSNLPILIINLNERMAEHSEDRRVSADMIVVYRPDGSRNYLSDTISANLHDTTIINYMGKIGIKYRGSSSFSASDKKPFNFETQDIYGNNRNVNLLGMGSDEDWTLLAPYNDKSLIRDVLTFDLMRGYLEYVPTGKFCELIIDGVYEGVYIVAARVLRGPNRINLPRPLSSGNNLTGGYLLEIDRNSDPVFYSTHNYRDLYGNDISGTHCFQYKYPESDDYANGMSTQQNYIINRVYQFEDILASDDFKDPENGYRTQIDVLSAIDYMLAEEITHNVDGYRLSTSIYKYRDSVDARFKLSIWDFNISLGNADYCDGWSTQGWSWNLNKFSEPEKVPFWFKRLLEDEVFRKELRSRWAYYRQTNLSNQNINNKIDSLVTLLNEAQARNFTAWNRWDQTIWPNYYVSSSWTEEISYLRSWLLKRVLWMDSQFVPYSANLVANASFDSDSRRTATGSSIYLSNWQSLNSNSGLSSTVKLNGTYSLSLRNQDEVSQTITELAKGNYTFKAWVRTAGNPMAEIEIRNHNITPIYYSVTNNTQFYEVIIPDIEVITGVCDLVFKADFTTGGDTRLYVDSVSFFRQRDENYPYHPTSDVDLASSNLPIVVFNMNTQMIFDSSVTAMTVINRINGTRNRLSDIDDPDNLIDSTIVNFNGIINLAVSAPDFEKKSFTFITRNDSGNVCNMNILNLGEGHSWRLEASNDDKSFIREILAGNLFNGCFEYSPDVKPCELVINDIYQGIYLLSPDLDNDRERLNLTMPGSSSPAITGSYLLGIGDTLVGGFSSGIQDCDLFENPKEHYTRYGFIFPSIEDFNAGMSVQQSYITGLIDDFENVMAGNNFSDPALGYRKYIDTLSVSNYMLIQEFLRNPDAYRSNLFLLKKNDNINSRLKFLIPHFSQLTGNTVYYDGWSPEGWVWNQNRFDTINMIPFWIKRLLSDDLFLDNIKSRWAYFRQHNLSDANILQTIDSLSALFRESCQRNYTLWNNLTETVAPNYYTGSSWNEEVLYLKNFLLDRAAWMDSQLLVTHPANVVANYSFDSDASRGLNDSVMLSSWSLDGIGGFSDDANSGRYAFEISGNSSFHQTVTELATGIYTLYAEIKTYGTPDAKLQLTHYAENDSLMTVTIYSSPLYNNIILENIPISSGLCDINFVNSSTDENSGLILDDITLSWSSPLFIPGLNDNHKECYVYPVPFDNQITFEFIPSSDRGELSIYSVTGVLIDRVIINSEKGTKNRVYWNSPDNLPSGIFIYHIRDGECCYSGKIVKM
jgi:hypothetical protein